MIPPSPTPLESVLDLLCTVAPPPLPVIVAIRMGTDAELEVHPLDPDDPLGSADRLVVGADVDAVVAAVPASIHPGEVTPDDRAGTLLHLVARGGEAHTRWVDSLWRGLSPQRRPRHPRWSAPPAGAGGARAP